MNDAEFFVHDPEDYRDLLESAFKPLAKVEELEEQNYNMIDNVLNNIPKDKRPHSRVSMKAKLAEKKAEVEKREKKPPDKAKTSKYPGMGVDD